MKKTLIIISLIGLLPLMQGCASGFNERKAPCPPTAGLFSNPCNPLPINIAEVSYEQILAELI